MDVWSAAPTLEGPGEELSLLRLMEPSVLGDPHSLYRALREHDPVHWDPHMHACVVTSYPEVLSAFDLLR
jgi:hypothetical protein